MFSMSCKYIMYLILRREAFSVNSPSVKCNYAPLGARQLSVKKTCIPMCFRHLWRVRYKTAVVLYLHPTLFGIVSIQQYHFSFVTVKASLQTMSSPSFQVKWVAKKERVACVMDFANKEGMLIVQPVKKNKLVLLNV